MKRKIAVLTSGGDSPGMNAAIRAITRTAIYNKLEVYGVLRGYEGLYNENYHRLNSHDVANIIKDGGTILETSRFPALKKDKIQQEIAEKIKKAKIDTLFVIGGNGSLKGAYSLIQHGVKVIFLPGSIDNDIPGTEISIGVDTALNTILFAVDHIKDTASSHERTFLIEVMGRNSGYLALMGSLATGADYAVIPEYPLNIDEIIELCKKRKESKKRNTIIIVAEGAISVNDLEKKLEGKIPWEIRKTILGHIQRGGSPTAYDRILATKLGTMAIEQYLMGNNNIMVGYEGTNYSVIPIDRVINMVKPAPTEDIKKVKYMSI